MKPILICCSFFLLASCGQNDKTKDSEKIYGSPKAIITNQPDNERGLKGPLSYGPEVPKLQEGDTIDVKFDVTHQLFKVSGTVSYIAWMFGNSVPGPVLKIRVG